MNKIIIDTDPGVDDALAIMLAVKSEELQVEALTTVYGNSTIENTTKNALAILEIIGGRNIPVYIGATKPIVNKMIFAKSQGVNGLGGFTIEKQTRKAEDTNAIDYFIRTLTNSNDKEITIVCIGPTTNLALLGIIRPELISKIKEIVILGGAIGIPGNKSSVAEFNVLNDPDALKQVLSFDCEKVLIPINVCQKVLFTTVDFNQLRNRGLSKQVIEIAKMYIDYYMNDEEYGRWKGGVMYDTLAISYLINPVLFDTVRSKVGVINAPDETNGLTYLINGGKPNSTLVTDVNANGIKNLFFKTLNQK